jgi:hypothetical protein
VFAAGGLVGLALFAVVALAIAGRRRSLPGPEKIVEWADG